MENRENILNNGFEQADYSNQNKIVTLYILSGFFFVFSVICLSLTITLESTIHEQSRQIKDRDSLITTLQVMNDTINYKLLPIGE